MNFKNVALYLVLSPFIAYALLKKQSFDRVVKKTIENLDFDYALNHQKSFFKNLDLNDYSILNLKSEHSEAVDLLKYSKLTPKIIKCSKNDMLIKSTISYNMPDNKTYSAEINMLWGRNINSPIKISLQSSIDSKIESGMTLVFLPLPPNPLLLDDLIGVGAEYNSLSNRITHERKGESGELFDQYFLLEKFNEGTTDYIGFFGAKIDTEPVIRGFHPRMFKI